MKSPILILIIFGSIFGVPTVAASQSTTALAIAAGPSAPVGRLRDEQSSGFGGTAGVVFGSDGMPFGLRLDAGYDRLRGRTINSVAGPTRRIISGVANVLFTFPGSLAKPYLAAGVGSYRMQADTAGAAAATRFGFDFGSGISFPLSSRSAFLEAQLHSISQHNAKPLRFVRVVFGLLL